jgi:hypothetical protein
LLPDSYLRRTRTIDPHRDKLGGEYFARVKAARRSRRTKPGGEKHDREAVARPPSVADNGIPPATARARIGRASAPCSGAAALI